MKDHAIPSRAAPCRNRRAFTLVELLVVIMIIIILAGILMPALMSARIEMLRSKCRNNLRSIGQACNAYTQDITMHRSSLPNRTTGVLPCDGSTGWDNTARGLWILIGNGFIGREYFLCPEAELRRDYKAPGEGDTAFTYNSATKTGTLSYAYLAPLLVGGVSVPTNPATDLYGGMIILADDNPRCTPGGSTSGNACSENHNSEGQNVADYTGSVRWTTSPVVQVTASRQDNIYVQGDNGSSSAATRASIDDVYLIP